MPTPFVVGVTYGNLLGHMNTRTDTSGYLAVSGVSKSFGHTVAVSGVSISVTRGETLAILGPSGCGKTTLLRVIAGLESPDVGSISLDGNVLVDGQSFVRPERRRIGMVFQGLALFPHMSVAENVGYGLARHADRSRRVGDALALVDMAGFESRAPESLSGGQAQRVALARALAPQPDVLLLDEPFASLDAELRIRVRAEVAALLRTLEITAVFVTHDQEEAFVVGDHVAVMRDGCVVQTGTPTELYERPTSAWIAPLRWRGQRRRGRCSRGTGGYGARIIAAGGRAPGSVQSGGAPGAHRDPIRRIRFRCGRRILRPRHGLSADRGRYSGHRPGDDSTAIRCRARRGRGIRGATGGGLPRIAGRVGGRRSATSR